MPKGQRFPWTLSDKHLLQDIRSNDLTASVSVITEAFNKISNRRRTEHAVSSQLKVLNGASKKIRNPSQVKPSPEITGPSMHPVGLDNLRYAWTIPQLGIFIPLHPIVAEARLHASGSHTVSSSGSISKPKQWPSQLCLAETPDDTVLLRQYLNYLEGRTNNKREGE